MPPQYAGRMAGPGDAYQPNKQQPYSSMMGVAPPPAHHHQHQQPRHSPVNLLQRKTPSPIMTADDYFLHKQQQEQFLLHEQELQETNEFLQACRDQLRYYLSADSASSDPVNMENLMAATTFVAS